MEVAVLKILADYGYDEDIDETVNVEEAGSETKFDQTYFEEMLLTLKKVELIAEVRKHHLPASGNKRDLVKRILENIEKGFGALGDNGSIGGELTIPAIKDPVNSSVHEMTNAVNSNGDSRRSILVSPVSRTRIRTASQSERKRLKEERQSIVLWRHPITTIHYGVRELFITLFEWGYSLLQRKLTLLFVLSLVGIVLLIRKIEGPHRENADAMEKYILWLLWWVGLGVLSSVGLGTGLHTFLIYLGPHIAAVTLAAYECASTEFPSPPYPDRIICPDVVSESSNYTELNSAGGLSPPAMTIWTIMSKVRIEAFCWGFGTALGELPPYFMARAHRLSGYDPDDDDDEDEFLELQQRNPEDLNTFDRAKLGIERLVERVGFFGILACASVPNPLFDLAGITCGHFLVPFWTFFGATVIGKALVKMHIQKLFVIFAFNESLMEAAVTHIHQIPWIGPKLEAPFKELLTKQKEKLHRKTENVVDHNPGVLGWIFEKLVVAMILYFLLSILNSLAQSYHKRLHKKREHRE